MRFHQFNYGGDSGNKSISWSSSAPHPAASAFDDQSDTESASVDLARLPDNLPALEASIPPSHAPQSTTSHHQLTAAPW